MKDEHKVGIIAALVLASVFVWIGILYLSGADKLLIFGN
jgi:hypothetical protein